MQKNNQKTVAGVWLDNTRAVVISNSPDVEASEYEIKGQVKSKESHGGGSEHSMNNAKNNEVLKFFKSITGLLANYDEILIFGPGKVQEQFHNFLKDDHQFKNKQIIIDSSEQMTDPQMIAKVRTHFTPGKN